jgi:hypothetical protein
MKPLLIFNRTLLRCLAALFLFTSLFIPGFSTRVGQAAPPISRVAYVYGGLITDSANAYNTMLTSRGITVDVYNDLAASTANFGPDQTIIISDDMDLAAGFISYNNIWNSGKPVVAIGDWGKQYLTMTSMPPITGGTGFITTSIYDAHVADPTAPIWSLPSPVSQINQYLSLYSAAVSVNALGIPTPIQFTNRIGRVPGDPNHYSIFSDNSSGRCYTYWGYRGLPTLITPSGENLFLNLVFGNPCKGGSIVVNSALASTPPVMDGVFNYNEWSMTTNRFEMDHGFALVMNDNLRLYLLVDVLESIGNNTGASQNDFSVTFDTNNDGTITPTVDLNYGLAGATRNMRYQHYLGPANWDFLSASTKSSLGPGFDCYTPDNTKVLNINTQKFDCFSHQIWEIAIDLKEISAVPGQTIHMGLRTHTPNPNFTDEVPNAFEVDFSNLISVNLANQPIPTHDPNANIAFATPDLEVTQVVQDTNNSIPMVANKNTAGRIAVISTNTSVPQPVLYYLYGTRGGSDLPGSPLLQQSSAPLIYDRGKLNATANFLLPTSWTNMGEETYMAETVDFNGHDITSSQHLFTYSSKADPVYWIIQENNATANAPDLPAQSTIDSYESYVKTVFPVPDVTFVQKPWTVLGALNGASLSDNVAAVAKYYNAIAAVYWNDIMMLKVPPYALPELIFGAANVGGGLSDPTWYNSGGGHAAAGGNASSAEGVVAHEFNHDLDRSSSGTWGRHVGACGASGPDPSWPNGSNPAIGEYGFDTRLPWLDTNSNKTVVPTTTPDLMSYCQSGYLPTKWISPYRYNAWFGSSIFPAASAVGPVNSIYLTGTLISDGTGSLDPALFAPGMPISPSAAGAYSIQLSGVGIPTVTYPFDIAFQDVEGNPQTMVHLNFTLADPGAVSTIQLMHGSQILYTLTRAGNLPSANFITPDSGPLSGTVAVSWSLTPGDTLPPNLRQMLEFSADNGNTWTPVAVDLPGTITSYALDTNLLSMTTQGRLRLVILDGLNLVNVDSTGTFSVGNHPPFVDILAPLTEHFITGGSQVFLQGQASDVDEAVIPDGHFQWTLDGDTVIGLGRNQQVVLPNGKHTLTLTVLDSNGGIGSASVTVYVNLYRLMLPMVSK